LDEDDEGGDTADGGPDTPSPDSTWDSQRMSQYDSDIEDQIYQTPQDAGDELSDLKPICKYGETCYRQNPAHFQRFAHPWKK